MNLVELEGLQDVWDDIPEYPQDRKAPEVLFPDVDRTDPHWETQPDEYYCMRMWRFPNWWV